MIRIIRSQAVNETQKQILRSMKLAELLVGSIIVLLFFANGCNTFDT